MKFSAAIGALLAAEAVLAAPGTEMRRERAKQRALNRISNPRMPASDIQEFDNGTHHASYSTNWAGAVLIGSGYTAVTGTFTVPTPKAPAAGGGRGSYAASAWVGIDGDTCTTSILQTGIDFTITEGRPSFQAWYEWFPAVSVNLELAIEAGHKIELTVTATSKKTGSAIIKNLSTGKETGHTFKTQSTALCETNAEWIVEDFEEGSSLVPFADFGTVTFSDATVTTAEGVKGVTGATIIDLRQDSKVLTSCSASGESVTCTYL